MASKSSKSAKTKTVKEVEEKKAPEHSPKIGDRVPVILRNGKERFLDVVAVYFDDTPEDNVTVKGTLHSLGLEDGESNNVTSGTFRYSKTDEDETGSFPVLTWHYPDDTLQPKPAVKKEPAGPTAKPQRPDAVAGDRVLVGTEKRPGEIVAAVHGVATLIQLDDGTKVTDASYVYVDEEKAKADADFQASK